MPLCFSENFQCVDVVLCMGVEGVVKLFWRPFVVTDALALSGWSIVACVHKHLKTNMEHRSELGKRSKIACHAPTEPPTRTPTSKYKKRFFKCDMLEHQKQSRLLSQHHVFCQVSACVLSRALAARATECICEDLHCKSVPRATNTQRTRSAAARPSCA